MAERRGGKKKSGVVVEETNKMTCKYRTRSKKRPKENTRQPSPVWRDKPRAVPRIHNSFLTDRGSSGDVYQVRDGGGG